ncbi:MULTISPECIES: pilus assembly protein PilP [Psychrobacter]|mgnify:FL=1|jgi:type IV pilus assembly protein PilP|uniref:pilus assembly protein PilP n=1 Tax=Psychrobacter TaxID=497 RepID=UPI00070E0695|nr:MULTISPECIES: pilus assembly protein PilP [Psychrobacter]KRG33081.1 pilus assembly protein PilQ [Psychrobacter sp. P11G3]MBA6243296.1 pilus assembly protein PilP [Psychrobacter sp. Urea-trap-18]MBA6285520.1 pilus assembly protein PilP [Psychrobacter sp. Urea-trap-16]MBA6317136.1 pilus assembly protein PilP [Psychrobacter sp. Urea-trap-20]MBA6333757.1 pilus assembly protein PilP [Psychrobacter sp. Urea-trap-19]|tara:strand:+ start:446 stop:979 length:534 start_codon:yes stop_codon:yes gene_type:complete
MNIQRMPMLLVLSVAVLSMTGCSDRIGMAEQAMTDIRNQPAQPIEPPPKAELVEDFVYSASSQRSPFLPPSLVNVQGPTTPIDGVRPDINRIKEPLEQYELSQLVFRGVVISPEGQRYALIQRPDGSVASVKVGDYLGLNDGRIVEITPTQVNLIEIVPDSRAGFVEKPQSLVSPIS